MAHSDIARTHCLEVTAAARSAQNRRRGRDRAETADAEDAHRRERVRRNLTGKWKADPTVSASMLIKSLPSRDREVGRQVAEELANEYVAFPRLASAA